ncbi:hypothetical protein GLOTRDRAFT_131251 [Gloeophyllum trabeum ATCC 11539]|uniref:Hypervirulence associated protein TUDOR domain-containing protein n=1 Tax=Gloeophyllum trabeum (strain ATCC 11539 / FP-39264 / Madison 617) TaxID=670483 RepID=S7Q0C2_GLOTA|nr:uncharacterized protein GLOTRDRAFT_131251 [Gloeophyllum trabeum ATCC 11539]EPQ52967.1 hypothetical protein GLOTRDRAFT_131251 [Gloeophyllum trabeum ATCC 11539]
MAEQLQLHEGQEVSWKWGSGNPSGRIAEIVTEGHAEVTSNKVHFLLFPPVYAVLTSMKRYKGNTVKRNAKEGDPAVKITRKGNDVVKLAHELNEVKNMDRQ